MEELLKELLAAQLETNRRLQDSNEIQQGLIRKQEESNRIAYLNLLLNKEIFTMQEAADFMGKSYDTIAKWTGKNGTKKIAYFQPDGKMIYITKAECLRVMQLNYHPGAEELYNLQLKSKKGVQVDTPRRSSKKLIA